MEDSNYPKGVDADVVLRSRFISGVFVAITALSRSLGAARPDGRADGYRRLESALVDLSRVFYYAEGLGRVAPLRDELSFVEQYLGLQAFRFEGRLTYRVIADGEAMDRAIPRLALFDYLELAVAESLELSTGSAFIAVEAALSKKGDLELRVARGLSGAGPLLDVGVLRFAKSSLPAHFSVRMPHPSGA